MKTLFIVGLISTLALSALAQTNTSPASQTTLEKVGGTNLQDVVVDILRGAKGAGSEDYAASKQAITKAVDFTMEQAPLVVKEFLRWQVARSIFLLLIWAGITTIPFYVSRRILKYRNDDSQSHTQTDKEFLTCAKWAFGLIASLILFLNVGYNGMRITKVCVAPRVFLIEYVVDSLKPPYQQTRY